MEIKLQDDDLNIDHLSNNEVWQETRKVYFDNKNEIDLLINDLSRKHDIGLNVARDAVIYEIMSCQYKKNSCLNDSSCFKWILIYFISLLLVFFSGLLEILCSIFGRKSQSNVVYEEMWSNKSLYNRYYKYIDSKLGNKTTRSLLYISPGLSFLKRNVESWDGSVINKRKSGFIFEFSCSMKVVKRNLFYGVKLYRYSSRSNVNLIYLYLRVLRKLLMYYSQSSGVKSDVLISAGDYYWSPLKYHIYKRNFRKIILLQHNYVNEYLHQRLFQYCDYYYAHSQQSIDKHALCGGAKFSSVGSFQLIPFINKNESKYDIAFISQTVYQDLVANCKQLDQKKLQSSYSVLIDNFYAYLEKNPNKKAIYISKVGHETMEPTIGDKKKFKNLDNIKFVQTAGKQTFDYISKSCIVINMYSSVGFESYGLEKRVLWINYDRCCDVFKYDTEYEDIHVMISDNSYSAFEDKINLLLSNSRIVDVHYNRLKKKYMNVQGNPADKVAVKIRDILHNEG